MPKLHDCWLKLNHSQNFKIVWYVSIIPIFFHIIPYDSNMIPYVSIWFQYFSISFHMIPYYSISFHMIPYYSISFHMIPYYSIWFHMIPYYSISFHMIPYYSISFHMIPYYSISFHMIPYYSIWFHMIPYYSISFHMIPYYSIWFHMIPYYSISFHMIPYYSIWFHMIPYGSLLLKPQFFHPGVPNHQLLSTPCGCLSHTKRMETNPTEIVVHSPHVYLFWRCYRLAMMKKTQSKTAQYQMWSFKFLIQVLDSLLIFHMKGSDPSRQSMQSMSASHRISNENHTESATLHRSAITGSLWLPTAQVSRYACSHSYSDMLCSW